MAMFQGLDTGLCGIVCNVYFSEIWFFVRLEAMHSWNTYFSELYQTSKGQKTKKAEEMD